MTARSKVDDLEGKEFQSAHVQSLSDCTAGKVLALHVVDCA